MRNFLKKVNYLGDFLGSLDTFSLVATSMESVHFWVFCWFVLDYLNNNKYCFEGRNAPGNWMNIFFHFSICFSVRDGLHKPKRWLCFSFCFVFLFLCKTEFFSRNQRRRCFLRLIHQNSFEAMVLWMDIGTCSHSFVKFLLWSNWSILLFMFIIIFCGIESNYKLCF